MDAMEAKWRFGSAVRRLSAPHAHDYDEYMIVVQGSYTLIINGEPLPLEAGEEYLIPRGVLHSGEVLAGT